MASTCKPGEHNYTYRYDDGDYEIWMCTICSRVDRRRVNW